VLKVMNSQVNTLVKEYILHRNFVCLLKIKEKEYMKFIFNMNVGKFKITIMIKWM
jgi:hypothetical protein